MSRFEIGLACFIIGAALAGSIITLIASWLIAGVS